LLHNLLEQRQKPLIPILSIVNGFIIIEIREKINKSNVEKGYLKIWKKLYKSFAGVAPKWMQDFAEKAKIAAEEIRKIGEELEKAGETHKF